MKQLIFIFIGLSSILLADYSRDNMTQIVTDNNTGLQWQDNSDAKLISKTWAEAISYCEALTLGGYSDWRMPNFNELFYLADRSKANPSLDNTFQNIVSDYYWSSTTVVDAEGTAWNVHFGRGIDNWDFKSNSDYVRCVRSGE